MQLRKLPGCLAYVGSQLHREMCIRDSIRTASRDFPMPPGPHSVRARAAASKSRNSLSSRSRPTKLFGSSGVLPWSEFVVTAQESSLAQPAAWAMSSTQQSRSRPGRISTEFGMYLKPCMEGAIISPRGRRRQAVRRLARAARRLARADDESARRFPGQGQIGCDRFDYSEYNDLASATR